MSRFHRVNRAWGLVAFLVCFVAHAASAQQTAGPESGSCRYSDQTYANDGMLMKVPKGPTHFRLMGGRYLEMVQAVRGYDCAGTVTVGFDGHHYLQTGRSDDAGIMEWVPTLSQWTGLSLANAYDLTIFVTIATGLTVGYVGLWKQFPRPGLRWICGLALLLMGLAEMRVADEYIFQVVPLVAGIPWLLYFASTQSSFLLTVSAAVLAFCCAWCSLVRSGTSVISMTFLLSMFALRHRVQRPFFPFVLLMLACLPAFVFEKAMIHRQHAALSAAGDVAMAQDSRPFWHTFYIGLGFLHNSEVPEYRDEVARDKVRSIDPAVPYTSREYERILRGEVWGLLKRRPMLVIGNLAAKAGIVSLFGLALLFPMRRLLFADREMLWLDMAFTLTIAVSAVNSLVAVPRPSYLLTFFCLAVMFVAIKICAERYA